MEIPTPVDPELSLHSELDSQEEQMRLAWQEALLAYSDYYASVSRQPVNLPAAHFIFWDVLDTVQSACDLGSGFSSALLRFYSERVRPIEVFSVDDNPEWLARTGQFLQQKGLGDKRLLLLNEAGSDRTLAADLVIHDLGSDLVQRIKTFPLAHRLARKYIFVDDTNYPFYRWPLGVLFPHDRIQTVGKHPGFRKYGSLVSVNGVRLPCGQHLQNMRPIIQEAV